MSEWRVLSSAFINGFGNWLTFIALSLMLSEKFGTQHVAYNLLIQSLPALIVAPILIRRMNAKHSFGFYHASLMLSSLSILLLTLDPSLSGIYVILFVGSLVGSVRTPLFWSLATSWFAAATRSRVNTRLAAINGITLCLAPPFGAWLSGIIGFHGLFIVNAATFVLASALLFTKQKNGPATNKTDKPQHVREKQLSTKTQYLLGLWYGFLLVGAIFNAIEFEGFRVAQLSREEIGLVLGFWGLGNFASFLAGGRIRISGIVFLGYLLLSFALFPLLKGAMAISILFAFAGFAFSQFSGYLRAQLQTEEEGSSVRPIDFWTLIQRRTALINLIGYGFIGLLIQHKLWEVSVATLWLSLVLCAFTAWLYMRSLRNTSHTTLAPDSGK